MRILLLVSAFNGLSQRVWCELRVAGHDVGVLFAGSEQEMIDGVRAVAPDLILCPFLKQKIPRSVWERHRTVIIHPGPVGDRGPSSLDWAILGAARRWGVTALQAVDEMDAGPIWATRTFAMPDEPVRKSALYNSVVADAALECVLEVVARAEDPSFEPVDQDRLPVEVPDARPRPPMTQADRAFAWEYATDEIVRCIRAADGSPGVRVSIGGNDVYAYDAYPGQRFPARPGRLLARRRHAVQVATGDGSVWLGHLREAGDDGRRGIKLPASHVLRPHWQQNNWRLAPPYRGASPLDRGHGLPEGLREITYRRDNAVGWLTLNVYNGAMSTDHCQRLAIAWQYAASQDTRVIVLTSGTDVFSNGIDLATIDAAADPAAQAWENIQAINEVCRQVIDRTRQLVIAAYAGNAGAGGAMLGLGADIVAARAGIVLNPSYDIGLYGSELHTYTLPRKVGTEQAQQLLTDKLPVTAEQALGIGLVDEVGPRDPNAWTQWLAELARSHSTRRTTEPPASRAAPRADRLPVAAYEIRELAEMSRDIFDDRNNFTQTRRSFLDKTVTRTPQRLAMQPTLMIHSTSVAEAAA
jgi:putative two-component system hydrogenase maturation factor HypX/HoxX